MDDEQEVIDCLHSTQRALMEYELKVVLESEGLCFKVRTPTGYVIEMRFTNDMINYTACDDEALALALYRVVHDVEGRLAQT